MASPNLTSVCSCTVFALSFALSFLTTSWARSFASFGSAFGSVTALAGMMMVWPLLTGRISRTARA